LVLVDVDQDGELDVLLEGGGSDGGATVLFGDGSGGLGPAQLYRMTPLRLESDRSPGVAPQLLRLADFNGDGRADLLSVWKDMTIGPAAHAITVRLGLGDGGFGPVLTTPTLRETTAVGVGQIGGGAALDLVLDGPWHEGVSVYLGTGDGTFDPGGEFMNLGNDRAEVWLVEVTGDEHLDVLQASQSKIGVLPGFGDGTFGAEITTTQFSVVPRPSLPAQLDGDGVLDLLLSAQDRSLIRMLGNGDGTFGAPLEFPGPGGGDALTLGHVAGDGNIDLVFTTSSGIGLLLGEANGTFGAALLHDGGRGGRAVALGDLDGDGRLEVVGATTSVLKVWPHE
jgi:hypothetical protein